MYTIHSPLNSKCKYNTWFNLINKKHLKVIAFQTKDFFLHGDMLSSYNYTIHIYNKKSKYSFVTFAG